MVGYPEGGQAAYESKRLDHLGIVAGMFGELGLGAVADGALGVKQPSRLSPGMCLKAMIVNGLGFTTRPLYHQESFCEPGIGLFGFLLALAIISASLCEGVY